MSSVRYKVRARRVLSASEDIRAGQVKSGRYHCATSKDVAA